MGPGGKESDLAYEDEAPRPVVYRWGNMPVRASCPMHSHEWGEFVYSFSGVIEITINDKRYLVLPHYGIWVPPNAAHQWINNNRGRDGSRGRDSRQEGNDKQRGDNSRACNDSRACDDGSAQYCSVYIAWDFCLEFCMLPCSVQISPLMRSMLHHLRDMAGFHSSDEQERFLHVFMDQLRSAPCIDSYLPASSDARLSGLLSELEQNPGDNRSVKQLARALGMTERTLARRCRKELGITLLEWRQRLRIIKALGLLEEGAHVEHIALELGYSSSSAFIAMFKRLMGKTPAQFHPIR